MGMSRIRVTIDELKLSGFDAREQAALVKALQSELHTELAASNARAKWAPSRQVPALRLTRIGFEPGPVSAARLAGQVARAIGKEVLR